MDWNLHPLWMDAGGAREGVLVKNKKKIPSSRQVTACSSPRRLTVRMLGGSAHFSAEGTCVGNNLCNCRWEPRG